MALTDNRTALEALRDQANALPAAAQSVDGVAFGDTGATGDYAVPGDWLDNTATQIQSLTGATGGLTTEQMSTQLYTEYANVQNALAVLATKGVTIPDGANSNNLVELIAAIEVGGGGEDATLLKSGTLSVSANTALSRFTFNHDSGIIPRTLLLLNSRAISTSNTGTMAYALCNTGDGVTRYIVGSRISSSKTGYAEYFPNSTYQYPASTWGTESVTLGMGEVLSAGTWTWWLYG